MISKFTSSQPLNIDGYKHSAGALGNIIFLHTDWKQLAIQEELFKDNNPLWETNAGWFSKGIVFGNTKVDF